MPSPRRDLVVWVALVGLGFALTAVAVAVHAAVGAGAAPFTGTYELRLTAASILAPAVAVAVLVGVRRGVHDRLPWRWLLVGGFVAAFGWAAGLALVDGGNGLARSLELPDSSLRDVSRVGGDPAGFLASYVEQAPSFAADTRQHPPGGVLLLWALGRAGLQRPVELGLLLTAIGCLSVPLAAVAVRSLAHEPAARRLVPVLVLAPYALWLAVSLDAVTLTLGAAALACGVVGSEPRRSPWWAAAAGVLLGIGALFSYSAAWLGASLLVVHFVRRRPLLNIVSGAAALVPLGVVRAAGFVWPDGLAVARDDVTMRIGPDRSWLLWILLDLLLVAIATGPGVAAAARKVRRSPGWPFLVGGTLAMAFAIGSGLSRGEVERSFLPYFPWLLVTAVAPEPGRPPGSAAPTPFLLVAAGAVAAIVVQAAVRTDW